ncbi:MAG: glutamate racemase, partial [Bacteroidales bacterium]|nr:glutamate racemase [Bacteroidales bacterium]
MIGIFDSGLGGFSVLREILKVLPEQSYVYYADSANCPYGEKSKEFIIGRARAITQLLLDKGADIIVVACNTATAAAIKTLRAEWPEVPFVGMEPAVKPAALHTRSGVIGVLATAGTLKGGNYLDLREKYSDSVKVVEHVGRGFVELVEKGVFDGAEVERTVRAAVEPLLAEGADTIVLGCTHYPFLEPV